MPCDGSTFLPLGFSAVSLSLDPLTQDVTEGDDAVINVLLSNPSDKDIVVTFNTQDGTANGKIAFNIGFFE